MRRGAYSASGSRTSCFSSEAGWGWACRSPAASCRGRGRWLAIRVFGAVVASARRKGFSGDLPRRAEAGIWIATGTSMKANESTASRGPFAVLDWAIWSSRRPDELEGTRSVMAIDHG
jgi:hypothetical protein